MATGAKEALPTLGGTKFKTRKRDEKVKLDVASFSDQLIAGLNESGGNLEEARKFLDGAGSQLDYRCVCVCVCGCVGGWGGRG